MFEPRIVCFFCKWCTYAGADLAGTSRKQYPPNGVVVRVNCSGRIDPQHVLWAFREGADGVLIGGCHPGDCHYQDGNYKTMRRVAFLKRMLRDMGVNPARLHLEWISAAEGEKLVHVMSDFVETIKELGPMEVSLAGAGREKLAPPKGAARPSKKAAARPAKKTAKKTEKAAKPARKTAKKAAKKTKKAVAKPAKRAARPAKIAARKMKKAASKPKKVVKKAKKAAGKTTKAAAKPTKKAVRKTKKVVARSAKKAVKKTRKAATRSAGKVARNVKKATKAAKKAGRRTR